MLDKNHNISINNMIVNYDEIIVNEILKEIILCIEDFRTLLNNVDLKNLKQKLLYNGKLTVYEIKKINQNNFGSGGDLLKISQTEGIRLFRNVDHICPKCEMTLLLRHFFDRKRGLEVDQCARCGGIWIEMATMLKGKESEVEREKLIEDYFTFIYEKKILKMDLIVSDIRLAAEQILQVFRFLGMPETLDFKEG